MIETYEEYMKRKLSESVQYKPKEEDMAKYYSYEVEEQEEERPKKKTDWSEVALMILMDATIVGVIGMVAILYELFFA